MAVVGGAGVFASRWFNVFADVSSERMLSAADAHQLAQTEEIYLVDIRRPDEWARTGVAQHSIPLDMRRDDFVNILQNVFKQIGTRPVALICARGVRSKWMSAQLQDAGFTEILDVPEGMQGSGAGSGYLAQGLPKREPTAEELNGQI